MSTRTRAPARSIKKVVTRRHLAGCSEVRAEACCRRPVEETPNRGATIVRGVPRIGDRGPKTGDRAELLDVSGRKVIELHPGANDVSRLAPGVYFVREQPKLNHQGQTLHAVAIVK